MAIINLDNQKIEESFGIMQDVGNEAVRNLLDQLAGVLTAGREDDPQVQAMWDNCKAATEKYNSEFLVTVKKVLDEADKYKEISDYLTSRAQENIAEKLNTGAQAEFQPEQIDVEAIVM